VIQFGIGSNVERKIARVTNVTKRKLWVCFEDGEFECYSTYNNYRVYGSGKSLLTLQYTSHIIGNPRGTNAETNCL
jgi:hypothetical protein